MQRENAPETSAGLTTCVVGGAGYLSNADRFHSDTAGEEHAQRQQAVVRKQQAIEFRRNQSIEREDSRWRRIEEKQQQDAEKWNRLRESGTKSGKNQSSAAYDITNLRYHDNDDGKQQKYVDDMGIATIFLNTSSYWCSEISSTDSDSRSCGTRRFKVMWLHCVTVDFSIEYHTTLLVEMIDRYLKFQNLLRSLN